MGLFCVLLFLLLTVIQADDCTNCINVDQSVGVDDPTCLSSPEVPCQTLTYVLKGSASLNSTSVYLHGNHVLSETIEIKGIEGFSLKSSSRSEIDCQHSPNIMSEGSGIRFVNVVNISISGIVFKNCGTLHASTSFQDVAMFIIGQQCTF